ncbi:hypothetical protein GCM10009087_39190 [Sphingomonas oligophenolica]|uniref:Cytochrome P460 family protein n=1 Tax=Sphingomonas oligophenolica TaxID=301154 RepID=A0ABU9Y2D4_9SPHN
MSRLTKWMALGGAAVLTASMAVATGRAGAPEGPAAQFTAKGELLFPADYRSWTFLTSGHGMSYNAQANAAADQPFDNVFVNPEGYAAFLKTGHWPEGTMLVLEIRRSTSKGSINQHGAFQSGDPVGMEVHVHDSNRFKGGWGFFSFNGSKLATLIGYEASCYACHQAHAAVDTTFVQFYPTLLPVAKEHAAFSAAYLADEKAAAKP